jgi:hypothetical protein
LNPEEKMKWYFRPWAIFAAIFFFGPLGLFLLWYRPKTRLLVKIVISVLVFSFTIWTIFETVKYYRQMADHYEELAEVMESQ